MRAIFGKTLQLTKPAPPAKLSGTRFYSQPTSTLDPLQESDMKTQKLVLVNEDDEFIGTASKEVCHRLKNGKLPLHRAFSVYMFNSNKEFLLHQRAASKITYPNLITGSCCSHPLYDISQDSSEDQKLAAQRRLGIEFGLNQTEASKQNLEFITKMLYFDKGDGIWGEYELASIFVMFRDVTIEPNPQEVKKVWWVPRNEFEDFVKDQKYPLTPWFKFIKEHWLYKIWDNLDNLSAIRDQKIHRYV